MVRRLVLAVSIVFAGLVLVPQTASAHVERPSYWPDPKPDCAVSPCAGGVVPTARTLASALDESKPGRTRVVCKPNSMDLLRASVRKAQTRGYYNRPTDHRALTESRAKALLQVNARLFRQCGYHQIQPAVTASRNNDRVVVMPGRYMEPASSRKPTHDPACAKYLMNADSGDPGALTHEYQIALPQRRQPDRGHRPRLRHRPRAGHPAEDRHGIPNVGECIRCNVQLEGSGVSADDVIVEAGDPTVGNGGPSAIGHRKDVGIFLDRADGFVLRNVTVRHAREHDIYVLETDGYLLDRFKAYYAGGYGVLTFVGDHGMIQNCDAAGSGDSGLYPGSGADH